MNDRRLPADLARWLLGAAVIAVGIVDLVWGSFDPAHQPLQAWGDNIPGSQIFAYAFGVALVAGGGALFFKRAIYVGAILVGVLYVITAIFWLPRFFTAPSVLGYNLVVYLGVLDGVCQELVVVCATVLLWAATTPGGVSARLGTIVAWIVGLSAIDFGVIHLTGIAQNVIYVPHWMPFGRPFWVVFTGIAFELAGVAILSKRLDVFAARLLALMFFVFSAVTLIPGLIHAPQYEANWGGNAYEFVVVASVWVFAEWLATTRFQTSARDRAAPRST